MTKMTAALTEIDRVHTDMFSFACATDWADSLSDDELAEQRRIVALMREMIEAIDEEK